MQFLFTASQISFLQYFFLWHIGAPIYILLYGMSLLFFFNQWQVCCLNFIYWIIHSSPPPLSRPPNLSYYLYCTLKSQISLFLGFIVLIHDLSIPPHCFRHKVWYLTRQVFHVLFQRCFTCKLLTSPARLLSRVILSHAFSSKWIAVFTASTPKWSFELLIYLCVQHLKPLSNPYERAQSKQDSDPVLLTCWFCDIWQST